MPVQPALPTMSLGRASAGYALVDRLRALREGGIEAVELFYECLAAHADQCAGATNEDRLRQAAREIGDVCKSLGLFVIVLQPLTNATGLLDPRETDQMRQTFKLWLEVRGHAAARSSR